MKYKKEILTLIFLLTVLAVLLVNALKLPNENYTFRTLIGGWALIIFPIIAAVSAYRKSKILSYSFLSWFIGIFLWRAWDITRGTASRPLISELFFVLFFTLIIIYLFKEVKLKTAVDYAIVILILIAMYFAFVYNRQLSLLSFYGIVSGLIASLGLVSFAKKSESFSLGIFLFGAAEIVFIYAVQANGFYISGWVDFMYLLSWFVIVFSLMERKN